MVHDNGPIMVHRVLNFIAIMENIWLVVIHVWSPHKGDQLCILALRVRRHDCNRSPLALRSYHLRAATNTTRVVATGMKLGGGWHKLDDQVRQKRLRWRELYWARKAKAIMKSPEFETFLQVSVRTPLILPIEFDFWEATIFRMTRSP
jgi:hypothetical protein